jgi:hypothetical protein
MSRVQVQSGNAADEVGAGTMVFVGPTLTADEVRARLPGALVLPPVAVGDVLALAMQRRPPARVAIIDGYFERMAAVWHKEILVALARGISVWGAASMGALRAAELAPMGMIGVGAVYRAYARGELIADDEVAVAHLPAAHGFQAISDALVDLRWQLAAARRQRRISARTQARLIELAQARFYRDRTWSALLDDARLAGLPARELAALAAVPRRSRKAADARLLLARLAREPARPPKARPSVPRTWALRQLEQLIRSRS